jgi:hypothetical protein
VETSNPRSCLSNAQAASKSNAPRQRSFSMMNKMGNLQERLQDLEYIASPYRITPTDETIIAGLLEANKALGRIKLENPTINDFLKECTTNSM